jgi:hypothetical protein
MSQCSAEFVLQKQSVSYRYQRLAHTLNTRNTSWGRTDTSSTIAVSLQPCHSQLTLYARKIPNAVCVAPPEDKQVMLKTCRGL